MNQENLDINLLIESFSEKIMQLSNECVLKEATIKQLNKTIEQSNIKIENLSKQLKNLREKELENVK
jgi:uncharacterized coiled-coil protein SlyX